MDYLIRKTSSKLEIKEDIVDKVIRHQWAQAYKSANTKDQIEVTGIGYWFSSPGKIKHRLERITQIKSALEARILQSDLTTISKERYERLLGFADTQIAHLNKRLEYHEDRLERTRAGSIQYDSGEEMDQGTSSL
jgi:hypothetical protein